MHYTLERPLMESRPEMKVDTIDAFAPSLKRNHADGIAAVDLFVLPMVAFQTLYCLVVLRHGRRHWMSFGVTSNPTAEWLKAFPEAPLMASMRVTASQGQSAPSSAQRSAASLAAWKEC
jgi:hypothetical protein